MRALNPSCETDLGLLRFPAQGQCAIEGLRNRDLATWLDPRADDLSPADRRKLSSRESRLLQILKAHSLIRRIPKTHRYLVTAKGQRIAQLVVCTSTTQAKELIEMAA